MSSAAPGRVRDFVSSRSRIAVRRSRRGRPGPPSSPWCVRAARGSPPPATPGRDHDHHRRAGRHPAGGGRAPPSSTHRRGAPWRPRSRPSQALEQRLGRSLDIDHNFYAWDEAFPTEAERWDLRAGRIPMISWNGRASPQPAIAAGRYDTLIQERARETKALGQPVLIRWFWGDGRQQRRRNGRLPDEYIAGWQHIVKTFRDQGADNVSWVWCPNATAFNDGEAQAFYPGDDYVDWTCADGYNWAPGRRGDDWRSFKDIFSGFYGWAPSRRSPSWWASSVRRSGHRATRRNGSPTPEHHQNGLSAHAGRRLFQLQQKTMTGASPRPDSAYEAFKANGQRSLVQPGSPPAASAVGSGLGPGTGGARGCGFVRSGSAVRE